MRRFTISAALLLGAFLMSIPAMTQEIITTAIGGHSGGLFSRRCLTETIFLQVPN